MKRVFKTMSMTFMACLIFTSQSFAGTGFFMKDFTKTIIKEFDVTNDQLIAVSNRYGKVEVSSWDHDQVQYKIEIVVDAKDENAAEEVYKRIDISFDITDEKIMASTNIESSKSNWIWWSISDNADFSINYTILMPKNNPLLVINKYGDCSVKDITGAADFKIKYGNLHVYDKISKLNLEMGYGKAKIHDADEAHVQIKYSKFFGGNFESLLIQSKYSTVRTDDIGEINCTTKYDNYILGRVSTLNNVGKYDDFKIEEVSELNVSSSYSEFDIDILYHFLECDMRYGELMVHLVDNRFRKINLAGQYTEFVLGIDDVNAYDLEVVGDFVDWELDRRLQFSKEDRDGSHESYSGYCDKQNSGRVIVANLRYGSLVLK